MVNKNKKLLSRREFIKTASAASLYAGGMMASSHLAGCDLMGTQSYNEFDILIKNGIIYDGTLSQPYHADVGIKGDRITAVGTINGSARTVVDAGGCIVTPGFIDVHTHCDLTFKRAGAKRYLAYVIPSWKGNYNYIYQGVTTVITGNCGYGYTDLNEWFDIVESVNFGTNVFHLAPHGALRRKAFGRKQPRELSRKQMDLLKGRVADELEKGAIGLSTGLEYAPGWLATKRELIELARVAGRYNGIYTTHVRDESGSVYPDGRIGVLEAVKEAIEVGRRAQVPVEISHLKISSPTHTVSADQLLDVVERARMDGMDVTADQYPYDASSTKLSFLLPNEFESGGGVKREYKTRQARQDIRRAIREVFTHLGPEKIVITYYPDKASYEGKTVKEISELEGQSPEDSYTDMVCEDVSPDALFFSQDMTVVNTIMERDFIITASDGWTIPKGMTKPHPRIYGTFPRKLKKAEGDQKELVQILHSMTGLPATTFNLKDRGRIATTCYADIAVINPGRITDRATYKAPHQYSEGITHLLINGKFVLENGEATGTRNGKALRRG